MNDFGCFSSASKPQDNRDSIYCVNPNIFFWPLVIELNLIMCCCCLVIKSCLTLCHPMDYSPPGSSVHEVFQARIPEWVAMPPPGDFPIPGIVPMSPALAGRFFTTEPPGKSMIMFYCCYSVTKLGPTLQPHGLQNTRFPSPSLSLRVCSNSCPPVSDAIQPALWLPPSLLPPSLPAVSLSQHQRLFQ